MTSFLVRHFSCGRIALGRQNRDILIYNKLLEVYTQEDCFDDLIGYIGSIYNKLLEVYTQEDCFDDLIGYIGSLNKWSIFKKRPRKEDNAEYLFFNHSEEEMHLGFQFLITGILSVYYDESRNDISRPGLLHSRHEEHVIEN